MNAPRTIFLMVVLVLCCWCGQAQAQAPTPGEVQETLRPRRTPLEMEAPPPEVRLPDAPKPEPPKDVRRVRVNRFSITGNSVFSEEELREAVSAWEGSDLTLAEIYGVADLLTDFYQARGYSLTTVTVPAQRMQEGILRLEVVEGRVGQLVFSGNRRYGEDFLASRLDQVQPGVIIRFAELEREVLLLNDLPGLLARSVLVPGEAYGTSDIHLNIEETIASGLVSLDNYGRKVIGQWRGGADFIINNPGKFGDVLALGYTHTESGLLRHGRASYGLPLFFAGTRLNLSYSRAEYDVGEEFAELGIEGTSETARLQVSHPLLRSRRTNLAWLVGGSHIKGQSDESGVLLSDDEINFLETGFSFDHRSRGIFTLSGLFATNFRSNPEGSRSDALPPRLEVRGAYELPFRYYWSALVRGEAVISSERMPDSNMYAIGGPASVRGFVSSRERGDRGAMGSLEVRRFLRIEPMDVQLRGFLDAGRVTTRVRPDSSRRSESLTSAGAGGSVILAGRYVLDVQWAKPMDGKNSGEGHSPRIWMIFTAGF